MKTYIKLFAGLGNQLFQYSYGKYLEQQGQQIRFIMNRTVDSKRLRYELPECFCVDESLIIRPKSKLLLNYHKFIAKYVVRNWNSGFYQEYWYPNSLPESSFIFKKKNIYEQSEIYKKIVSSEAISLHIRGGEYITESGLKIFGNICTKKYYEKALEQIFKYTNAPQLFVFTNSCAFAKKILNNFCLNFNFIPKTQFYNDPAFDLFLMSQCKHNIIANSTYSWWGAFLNKNENKKIITPTTWTNDNHIDANLLIPPNWTKVKGN